MTLKEILLIKLNSLLNPKLESIVIRTFLSLGVLLVGVPSLLAVSASFTVESDDATFIAEINNGPEITFIAIGVLCLIVAAFFYFVQFIKEKKQKIIIDDITVTKDKKTIYDILKSINTNALDQAIERGLFSQFYDPALHYFYGVQGIAESSSFNIYNKDLNEVFNDFYSAFIAFVSHGEHFRETAHRDLHRFIKAHEALNWELRDKYENDYLSDVRSFSVAYSKFMDYVKNNYAYLDIEKTNQLAFEDYKSYNNTSFG